MEGRGVIKKIPLPVYIQKYLNFFLLGQREEEKRVASPLPGEDYTKIILHISGNKKIGRRFRPNALFQVHWSTHIYAPRVSQFWRNYY